MRGDAGHRRVTQRGDRFADLLRREAAAAEPRFSPALHERLLRRLPAPAGPAPAAGSAWARRPVSWPWIAAAGGAAALTVAIALVTTAPGSRQGVPGPVTPGEGGPAELAVAADEPGIERLPLYDDLEAGLREGVSTLAATLFEVPEWRMLADFDAAGLMGGEADR